MSDGKVVHVQGTAQFARAKQDLTTLEVRDLRSTAGALKVQHTDHRVGLFIITKSRTTALPVPRSLNT